SDEEVAKIANSDNKQVTVSCLKEGKTVLTAKSSDGQSFDVEITVKAVATDPVPSDDSQLPQTGYSDIYKVIAGLAALMTVSGAALVVKTRKENE
ncbi:MAG: LPXTG cell wall anchor domain-containing protein, partial [Ruminococcus sp.]|nr:LPXTG cell wall anchor domain-containing protein [Ruminococcus sp.]